MRYTTRFIVLVMVALLGVGLLGSCSPKDAPQKAQTSILLEQQLDGWRLLVDQKPVMINGMNWDYFPIGTNYEYELWQQPDSFVQQVLDYEMPLLRDMGVNALRIYTGIPPKWIQYIYENFGIYTMLNHSFGRYGLTFEGQWVGNTEYAETRVRELLLKEVNQMAQTYKGTPGLLLYLLGNENAYGLFWEGAETENLPNRDSISAQRAKAMYTLFNDAAMAMQQIDSLHPVGLCNGDLLFLDILSAQCPAIDFLGVNVYRGITFGDLYERAKAGCNKPVLLTEIGTDAFNAIQHKEDAYHQALYNLANWKEIYQHAAGVGKTGVSIGGFTFQWADGWWKTGQTVQLDQHDSVASWNSSAYQYDYSASANNMNEEWFGICAKGRTQPNGHYQLFPRASYWALKKAHQLNPYALGTDTTAIAAHFAAIPLAVPAE